MTERFPGIDWWCDRCGSHLNEQRGFSDRKYIWKCKECGYKNSISRTNIIDDDGWDSEDPYGDGFSIRKLFHKK